MNITNTRLDKYTVRFGKHHFGQAFGDAGRARDGSLVGFGDSFTEFFLTKKSRHMYKYTLTHIVPVT